MPDRDWSLVIFTTLAQLSIGLVWCFTLMLAFYSDMSQVPVSWVIPKSPVFMALVLIGIATLVSMSHLGSPRNAPNALNNLAGSWLSREILAIAVYSVSLVLVLVSGRVFGHSGSTQYFLLLSSVLGLALLWMMSRIYLMPTIPPWNSWYTPVSFVLTAVCLASLTFLVLGDVGLVNAQVPFVKMLSFLLIAVLFLEILSGFFRQSQLVKMNTGIEGIVFSEGKFHRLFQFRMIILIAVFLVLGFIGLTSDMLIGSNSRIWVYSLFVLIIAEEIVGRKLFYASYFRLGV